MTQDITEEEISVSFEKVGDNQFKGSVVGAGRSIERQFFDFGEYVWVVEAFKEEDEVKAVYKYSMGKTLSDLGQAAIETTEKFHEEEVVEQLTQEWESSVKEFELADGFVNDSRQEDK